MIITMSTAIIVAIMIIIIVIYYRRNYHSYADQYEGTYGLESSPNQAYAWITKITNDSMWVVTKQHKVKAYIPGGLGSHGEIHFIMPGIKYYGSLQDDGSIHWPNNKHIPRWIKLNDSPGKCGGLC